MISQNGSESLEMQESLVASMVVVIVHGPWFRAVKCFRAIILLSAKDRSHLFKYVSIAYE